MNTNTNPVSANRLRVVLLLALFPFSFTPAHPVRAQSADSADSDTVEGIERKALDVLESLLQKSFAGVARVEKITSGTIPHYGEIDHPIRLPEAGCYRIVAAGDEANRDLNLALLVDGKTVAADRTSGSHPAIRWCSPSPVDARVHLSVYSSHSGFALAVLFHRQDVTPEKAVSGGEEKDMIANRIRQLQTMKVRNGKPVTDVLRGNLPPSGTQTFSVTLASRTCYTAICTFDLTVKEMEVSILGEDGKPLLQSSGNGFVVSSTSPCVTRSGKYSLQIKVKNGNGQFGVQLFETPSI